MGATPYWTACLWPPNYAPTTTLVPPPSAPKKLLAIGKALRQQADKLGTVELLPSALRLMRSDVLKVGIPGLNPSAKPRVRMPRQRGRMLVVT